MKYLVEEPNGNVHEIVVPKNAVGQICFEKLCDELGIVERHYFGLTRQISNETKAWLNLRNPLMAQLRPHITGKPHRLRLDVKFYVLPQEIQHERTRHFFYQTLKRELRNDKFVLSQDQLTKLYALVRQAEYGDYPNSNPTTSAGVTAVSASNRNSFESDIRRVHESLKGICSSVAKLKFITLLSETEYYFCDMFKVKLGGDKVLVAVGTTGLKLIYRRTPQHTKEIVSYSDISKISLFEERMILVIKRLSGAYKFLHFFHTNCDSAKVMHKCVLEKKLFYYEAKILDSVRNHYMLSLPCWAYPSVWLARTSPPELYHLDVRCTRRQAYEEHYAALKNPQVKMAEETKPDDDHACHSTLTLPSCKGCNNSENMVAYSPCGHMERCLDCAKDILVCGICSFPVANVLKTYLAMDIVLDELVCQICMDDDVLTVFSPCGHVFCCRKCAAKLNYCPLCKRWVLFSQTMQFPFGGKRQATLVC